MRVRAMQPVFYGGSDRNTGEEFETEDDMHAKILIIAGRVVSVEDENKPIHRGRYKRRDMRADK